MALIGNVSLDRFILFITVIVATVIIGNLLGAYVKKYFKQNEKKHWFFVLLPKLIMYSIYSAGLYYGVYHIIKLDVKAFAAAFGIIGLAIAFSSQQIFQNMIAGAFILIDRALHEGEYIEFSGVLCKVEDISLRKTRLRAVDGRLMTVPNSAFITGTIVNYSRSSFYKVTVTIPIEQGSDIEKARSIIYQAAVEHPEVVPRMQPKKKSLIQTMLDIPTNAKKFEPKIWVKSMDKEKNVLEVSCWITSIRTKDRILSELLQEVKKQFEKEGIKLG